MRPLDYFFSLSGREKVFSLEGRFAREFVKLTAPVVGEENARSLCFRTAQRLGSRAGAGLGNMAAFLLGEFDDETMTLADDDWDELRETLEDASQDMDLAALTSLMGELLSRGRLKK